MGIDVSDLSPWAQKQVAQKLAAQMRERAQEAQTKQSKYHNTPDERNAPEGGKIRFDSKKEAARYDELMLMLKAGKIRDLKLQPQFTLQEAYTTPDGKRIRAIRYCAAFSYEIFCEALIGASGGGTWIEKVEDVKSKATKTRVYAMKKKLMQEKYGITITEVE